MTPHLATLQYNEMLRLLARRGIRKAERRRRWNLPLRCRDGICAAPVHELTAMYQAARFGGKPADPQHASSLLDRIEQIHSHVSLALQSDPLEPVLRTFGSLRPPNCLECRPALHVHAELREAAILHAYDKGRIHQPGMPEKPRG